MENNFSIHAKGSMNTFLHEMKDDFFETDTATPYQLNRFLSGWLTKNINKNDINSLLLYSKWSITANNVDSTNQTLVNNTNQAQWFNYFGEEIIFSEKKMVKNIKTTLVIHDITIIGVIEKKHIQKLIDVGFYHSIEQASPALLFFLFCACLLFFKVISAQLSPLMQIAKGIDDFNKGEYQTQIACSKKNELKMLADSFNRLGRGLDKKHKSQRRWLANISHELRTPITTLNCEIESLEDGIIPFNKNQLASFRQEVKRLQYLVDDLYELSLSQSGGYKYNFVSLDISDCIKKTCDSFDIQAKKIGIKLIFTPENDFICKADSKRIQQLFTNLINNSLSYTASPGAITITTKKRKSYIRVVVEDTPPAPKKDTEKLFDPFFRGSNEKQLKKGAGLGLTICRNIIEAHGGKIEAKNSKFGGLCITIDFPT